MRVIMPAIIDQTGRPFNVAEAATPEAENLGDVLGEHGETTLVVRHANCPDQEGAL